ncbi:hypothetical protein [Vogesella indigofera]|uniref:Uncharacterized protein n=1 Tax=Vogesella indigofera TaxID=45465 RepID=A0ABT5I4P4_VOGIN|nr:hypothetical protein [Vogesella indigofera]MDC7691119.1 hypothetical protein [Vogesella indigofera]
MVIDRVARLSRFAWVLFISNAWIAESGNSTFLFMHINYLGWLVAICSTSTGGFKSPLTMMVGKLG